MNAELHLVCLILRFARELLIAQIHAQLTDVRLLPITIHMHVHKRASAPLQENCKIKARIVHTFVPSPLRQFLNGSFVLCFTVLTLGRELDTN